MTTRCAKRTRRALAITVAAITTFAVSFTPGALSDKAEARLARPEVTKNIFAFYTRFGPRETRWHWKLITHLAVFGTRLKVEQGSSTARVVHTEFWRGREIASLRKQAHANGVKLLMTVTNYEGGRFSGSNAHDVLGTRETRQAAVRAIIREALSGQRGDGIVIDFERIDAEDSTRFTAFVAALSKAVHSARSGAEVYIAVPARNRQEKYDVNGLAAATDGIFLMSYVYHSKQSGPGPVAPLTAGSPWKGSIKRTVERYLDEGVSARKLIPAMRLAGHDWPATSAQAGARRGTGRVHGVPYAKFRRLYLSDGLVRRWDEASQTPYITYRAPDGQWHQIWVDDNQSARLKLSFVKKRGLWGLGLWGLGREDESLWNAVRETLAQPQ
jgi:spore germination protein